MRFSRSFIPTTKEAPKEATLPSHIYLTRAGFITQVSAGLYDLMPLGKRVLDKVRNVVKEELDKAGCEEVILPFVTPMELWEESGRASKMGQELLRIKDRKNGDFVLSPTNEEAMVDLVRGRITSYKNLPLNLYQINTKFRDEARPRFGLMRGREFLMKDGYSFHKDTEDMVREFNLIKDTYSKIFTRLGLDFRIVDADSGAIGGSGSKEFMVLADSGEDTIVVCSQCEYAANLEAAVRTPKKYEFEIGVEEEVHTPNTKTIEEVSNFLNISKEQTIKAVVKKALCDEEDKVVVFFVRGSDELEETKATNAAGANELVDISEEEMEKAGIVAGYVGGNDLEVEAYYDNELNDGNCYVIGANKADYHIKNFKVPEGVTFKDLNAVQEGDICSCCGKELIYKKGIEVGHIFQLGTKYSESLGANFLDENGKSRAFVMGTYGIGVSRLLAAIIEQHHDDRGCIWTEESAPYAVSIIVGNSKNEQQREAGEKIYKELQGIGVEVIIDDRKDRFGFKMKDFELIGFPKGIIVGKNIEDGIVEIVDRKTGEKTEVKLEEVCQQF
ncbi:MAG: proline--tRNA ligase [Campylobacterales bacterium]|nr:proline--tRNA ligase [Campylobacterales bacterium]